MKRLCALGLALTILLGMAGCGGAETPAEPAGEPFAPGMEVRFAFGTAELAEAALCRKTEILLNTVTLTGSGSGGGSSQRELVSPLFLPAAEGTVFLAMKGKLKNTSERNVPYAEIKGSVSFEDGTRFDLTVYPMEKASDVSYVTCFAGTEENVVIAAQLPEERLSGGESCTAALGETRIRFIPGELETVEMFGFDAVEGETDGEAGGEAGPETNTYRKIECDPPAAVIDDKYLTVYITAKFEDKSFLERSKPPFYNLGFELHMINHTKDKYITVNVSSISFNKITLAEGFYGCGYVAPGTELYTELKFNRLVGEEHDAKSANLFSVEDMVKISGVLQVYYNTDGGRSGKGLEKVKFKLD